jgi:hypothetical protein
VNGLLAGRARVCCVPSIHMVASVYDTRANSPLVPTLTFLHRCSFKSVQR